MIILFEDIDELSNPLIMHVLDRNIIQKGSSRVNKFKYKELEYDDNFRIFTTTKLKSPNYSPEISSRVSLINCCVTESGIQE